MMHHQMAPDGRSSGAHFPRSHLAEAVAKAKGGGGGGGGGGSGRGLMGQIIPIYGFGILLYILYILYKLSSKGKTTTVERKSPPIPGNMNRKITDYELMQLQEKLRETEEAMEKLINRVGPHCDRAQNVTTDQEKRLLQQLREITRVMKEGKLIDGISPEKEAEDAPYMEDWEECESHDMGQKKAQQISFSDQGGVLNHSHNFEKCYYCHYEEDDPAVIAENAGFHADSCSEAEDTAKDDLFMDSDNESAGLKSQKANDPDAVGILRKRNTKGLE